MIPGGVREGVCSAVCGLCVVVLLRLGCVLCAAGSSSPGAAGGRGSGGGELGAPVVVLGVLVVVVVPGEVRDPVLLPGETEHHCLAMCYGYSGGPGKGQ